MLSKIILGTAQLGLEYGINNKAGKPSLVQATALLSKAWDSGVRKLDTAMAYGDSHDVIRSFHQTYPTKKFLVSTKIKPEIDLSKIDFSAELGVAQVELLSLHTFNYAVMAQYEASFQKLKEQGKVNKLGVSVYTNEEVLVASTYSFIDVIQLPFNLLDNWNLRKSGIEAAKKQGKEIHIRSVFLQGLFFMSPDKLSAKLAPLAKPLRQLQEIVTASSFSMQEVALQYGLQHSEIDGVLIGVDSVDQLTQNLHALKSKVPQTLWREIETIPVDARAVDPRNWS